MKFLIPPADQSLVEAPEAPEVRQENQEDLNSIKQRAIEYIENMIKSTNNPAIRAFAQMYIVKIIDAETSDEVSNYIRDLESALREGGAKL